MATRGALGGSETELGGSARLNVSLGTTVRLDRVMTTFGAEEAPWLGERVAVGPNGMRRFSCDLELLVGPETRSLFRKAAIVGLGTPREGGDGWIVPVEWFAASLAPLFPVFVGELRLDSDRVELRGNYLPPGGVIGSVLDRALLSRAARGTGRWFLRKIASVLG